MGFDREKIKEEAKRGLEAAKRKIAEERARQEKLRQEKLLVRRKQRRGVRARNLEKW